jgi:hypothetical protein
MRRKIGSIGGKRKKRNRMKPAGKKKEENK